jgi:hypothetical protein
MEYLGTPHISGVEHLDSENTFELGIKDVKLLDLLFEVREFDNSSDIVLAGDRAD